MLIPARTRQARSLGAGATGDESGFTTLELMVVTLILGVVIAIAGSALVSLMNTASRNEAMVADEQLDSNALAQMARDIRSAGSIAFPSGATLADTSNEVELVDNLPAGGTSTVLWTYNPVASTLTRQVLVGSTFQTSQGPVPRVANPSGTPLFTYYDGVSGADISATNPSNIAQCTTAITVNVYVSAAIAGVSPVSESEQVAVTDRLNALTAPGIGYCR